MARKRGGLAGIWDRNKHIIKPVASGAGFLFGGPAGAAAVNGAISGFDRKGKGGIGFDVGEGLKGGVKGYLGGRLAQGLTSMGGTGMDGLRQMFSPGGLKGLGTHVGDNLNMYGGRAAGAIGGVKDWAMSDPKNLLALGQTAVGGLNAYGNAQQNAMMNQQTAQRERESQEKMRIRALLMPYFEQYMAGMTGGN